MDHLLYDCTKLQTERVKLISNISNQDKWPVNKRDLVKKKKTHETFKSVRKFNIFRETMNSQAHFLTKRIHTYNYRSI